MYEVRWLASALRSLDEIAGFIARDSPERARALAQEILERTEGLARFPFAGRAGELMDVRELVVHRNHLVSYRLVGETVEVLQVWHVARRRAQP